MNMEELSRHEKTCVVSLKCEEWPPVAYKYPILHVKRRESEWVSERERA